MIVLAFDTCLGACSAAVLDGERTLAAVVEPMWRGHQERIGSLVAQTMAQAGIGFDALDRVGVTVGPGSFTGLRVGLAFAKGLGLALDIPAIGVGTLEAIAHGQTGLVLALADARRDQVYWQVFDNGVALTPPAVSAIGNVISYFSNRDILLDQQGAPDVLTGPGAHLLAAAFPQSRRVESEAPDPVAIAWLASVAEPSAPKPIYLRAPDAKLPGGIDPFA